MAIGSAVAGFALLGCGGGVQLVEMGVTELPPPTIEPRPHSLGAWTGDELVVFGGWSTVGEERGWNDGAAYDPDSGRWRVMAPFPYPDALPESVAWTGDEMVVIAIEGDYPQHSTIVSAAYDPSSDTWRTVTPPEALRTAQPLLFPDTPAGIYTEPGPSVSGPDGRIFVVAKGKFLTWQADDGPWIEPHATDERLQAFREASAPVHHEGLIYQGLADRDATRHGLVTIDASTGTVATVEDLHLPGRLDRDIVGPLHPVFDGDELLLLGVESIGSEPRKATVLAEGDDGWEIVAQTDDEHFAGIGPSGYKGLVPGDDALFSLHFNNKAGVFVPSERTFGVLDLDEKDRCALGDGTVWTGTALIGWNGGHCRDEPVYEFQPEANLTVMVTPR